MIYYRIKNKINNLKKKYILRLSKFLYKIFIHLPIKDNLILFESEGDFCDNSWALYQYLKKKKKYKFVWFVRNPENFSNTHDTIFLSRFKLNRIRPYYYCARACNNFYTHWTFKEINIRKEQTVVNLVHANGFKAQKSSADDYFNYAVICGIGAQKYLQYFFGEPKEKFLSLGFARNDLLVNNIDNGYNNPFCKGRFFKKLILWMPTYRKSVSSHLSEESTDTDTGLPLIETVEELRNLDNYLEHIGLLILIKIHHLQADKDIFKLTFNNIIILTDKQIAEQNLQLYQIIGKTDALLTDYSGISFDYLLTGKPIGYILYDIKKYEKSRGFYYEDVRKLMPGKHIYNMEDLKAYFDDIINDIDKYKEDRQILKEKTHVSDKGDACYRICNYFHL